MSYENYRNKYSYITNKSGIISITGNLIILVSILIILWSFTLPKQDLNFAIYLIISSLIGIFVFAIPLKYIADLSDIFLRNAYYTEKLLEDKGNIKENKIVTNTDNDYESINDIYSAKNK
jgi:type IV secretory pathway TrbL component